jgi:hypothetical protein
VKEVVEFLISKVPTPLHGVKEILGVFFPQYWMMANYEVFFKRHLNAMKA